MDHINNQYTIAEKQDIVAYTRYNTQYDNTFYKIATHKKTLKYSNSLIDEALAICGSPYYKLSRRRWSKDAINFLKLFT